MMSRRPRCAHCAKVLMLGEDWFEAAPRVFYCEKDKRMAAPVEIVPLPVDLVGPALVPALAD